MSTESSNKRHKLDPDMAEHKIDELSVNTIRTLAADTVQKANSGHPGAPMGMAPAAHVLWSKIMKFNPKNTKWFARDRFVLSNGHACALQYILLHLSGYDLTIDDLKQFRQLHSKTPGHPESHITQGIEVTTGPLGQGIANGVGLAIAEAHLAAKYNKPGYELFNNYTYVFCGDGCLQEGVASEATSLAGHLGLGKLIMIYDDNRVTIDGDTELSFTEDVPKRFEAYGWHTLTVKDGDHDLAGIEKAIREAQACKDKPTIISLKTIIGFGATKQGTEAVHGAPLGADDVKKVKTKLGFNPDESFVVPPAVKEYWTQHVQKNGVEAEQAWNQVWAEYQTKFPTEAAELKARMSGVLPADYKSKLPKWKDSDKADATRNTSYTVLNALAAQLPQLVGGSADLTGSNKTEIKGEKDFQKATPAGRYLRFGVREHGMAAIGNGMHAYGGIIPFTATFFNFIEYCFPAVRLSCLAGHHQLFIMTHDSIGLGEDGPTHQAIEALALCRATPNLHVFRPADGNETTGSYIAALEHAHGPSVLVLTRQNCPQLTRSSAELTATRGGYAIWDTDEKQQPEILIVATGSEVSLAIDAAKKIPHRVRVVSIPSTTLFDKQPLEYRKSVIVPNVLTISFEALGTYGWERYSHFHIGMTGFGASAPYEQLYKHFGFTPDQVVTHVARFQNMLKQAGETRPPLLPILYANVTDTQHDAQTHA